MYFTYKFYKAIIGASIILTLCQNNVFAFDFEISGGGYNSLLETHLSTECLEFKSS
jgi:hypothetical protein